MTKLPEKFVSLIFYEFCRVFYFINTSLFSIQFLVFIRLIVGG
jgi:hypothetical protein